MAKITKDEFLNNIHDIINEGMNINYDEKVDNTKKFNIHHYVTSLLEDGQRNPKLMTYLNNYHQYLNNNDVKEFMVFEQFGQGLAQFATNYSGNSCDVKNDWAIVGNHNGFNDEEYNAIIDRAFAEKDTNKKNTILHEAEQYLISKMPIIPIAFNQNFVMCAKDISGIKNDFTGIFDYKKVNLKDYLSYYTTEAE